MVLFLLFSVPDGRSLKLVRRHGPCSPSNDTKPSVLEILAGDSRRVSSLQARHSGNVTNKKLITTPNGVSVPVVNAVSLGELEFVATIGLGSPTVKQTVIIDTGSDVCWVQCNHCAPCFNQTGPLFDPSYSSSYSRISCISNACSNLNLRGCYSGSCVYGVRYLDGSNTTGFLSSDKLTLSPETVFQGFLFGCGVDNHGFRGVSGLFGLGQGSFSLNSQTASTVGNVFSYCLPLSPTSTGWLTLGRTSTSAAAFYTPLYRNPRAPSLYYIDMYGISVGGIELPVSADVFRGVGTIIDSGTTLTYLPVKAYSALSEAFQRAMRRYNRIQGFGSLDTCYDFSGESTVEYPEIRLLFPGVGLIVASTGVFFRVGISQYCLAFSTSGGMSIIGNSQQRGVEVVYDVGLQRIGFGGGRC